MTNQSSCLLFSCNSSKMTKLLLILVAVTFIAYAEAGKSGKGGGGGGKPRQMPQEMIDEMMADFFKFTDKNSEQTKTMIFDGFKTSTTAAEKELKTVIRDVQGAAGLSSPAALVGQFTGPVNMMIGQFPGKVNELLQTFSDFYSKMNEQFGKLPPFKMQDPRAAGMKAQFKERFQSYLSAIEKMANEKAESYFQFVEGFKKQFEGILAQAPGGNGFLQELESSYQAGLADARKTLGETLAQFKSDIFAE